MGFAELLALLTALSGFGVDENPNAPTAADVLATAPAHADYMMHIDFAAIVPNNYARLIALPDDAALAKDKDTRDELRAMVRQLEGGRTMLQGMLGIDPIRDITSATLWLRAPDAGDPDVLLVVRGAIPAKAIDMLARSAGAQPRTVHGAAAFEPDPGELVAIGPRGELLAGSRAWVEGLLKKRRRKRASALTRGVARLLDARPAFVAASAPSKRTVRAITRALRDPEDALGLDLLTGHRFLGISVLHDGVQWSVTSRTAAGHKRALRASRGAIDVMRSLHQGSRGLARLVLAGLPSFAGSDETIAAIARHQDAIMNLVLANTGDGTFQVDIDDAARKRTLRVKAWGKQLSDVLPAAATLPLVGAGAAAFLLGRAGPAGTKQSAGFTPATP